MPTGDDDDGSVWATALPPQDVELSAVARANVSIVASVIAAAPNTRGRIIATAERLADLEEPVLKWIKQHLRIKQFYGTSEYAVKTQIWVAVSVLSLP